VYGRAYNTICQLIFVYANLIAKKSDKITELVPYCFYMEGGSVPILPLISKQSLLPLMHRFYF